MINVVFCIPGEIFSNNFLKSWTRLILKFPEYKVSANVRWATGTNIFKIRNDILLGNSFKGRDQKPFHGKLQYDYIMWIDSDQVFEPEQFERLLITMEAPENKKLGIISGVYLKSAGTENNPMQTTSVINFDHPDFPGHQAGFLTLNDIERKRKLIPVEFTGMGFMLVRYGVFESLDYPWFIPLSYSYDNDKVVGYISEDASFCKRAKDAGFLTFIDPTVIVGHEKPVILR